VVPPKYHVYVEYQEEEKSGIRFNLSEEELMRTFVKPFNLNKPFWFGGRLLSPSKVERVVVFWSIEDCSKLSLPSGENIASYKDRKQLIDSVCLGKVGGVHLCTDKFLVPKAKRNDGDGLPSSAERLRVHVIHDRDEAMKQAVTGTLKKLGLEPIILREEHNQGKTLLGEFSEYSDVCFAVVLLSPDVQANGAARASQDLVLEFGFFLGKLGGRGVLPVYRDAKGFVLPEEIGGVKYVMFDSEGTWRYKLAQALSSCGFRVDVKKIG
jgi:hypothetical protein